MRINKNLLNILILLVLTVTVFVVCIFITYQQSDNKNLRELVYETNFTQVWNIDVDLLPKSSGRPFLAVENNCVLFLAQPGILNCLDSDTGKAKWQKDVGSRYTGIVANNHFVFFASPRRSQNCGKMFTPHCNSIRLTAFEVLSGNEEWSRIYTGILVISQITANDSHLSVVGSGGHGAYSSILEIDANTGDLINYQEFQQMFVPPPPDPLPDFVAEKGHITSNTAMSDDIIYFFTDDAMLWALDGNTKTVLATAIFSHGEPYDTVQIAAQGDLVLIYFDNSQQLFALQLKR